jgi:hypothetical protein
MSDDDGKVQIQSFRVCFQLERRLHKIDRWKIPVPYGVPLRGIIYGVIALIAVVLLAQLPVSGQLLGILPVGLRYLVLPLGGAYLLMQWKLDGRSAHVAAEAWIRHQLAPKRVSAFRAARPEASAVHLGPITVAGGENDTRNRRCIVKGPGTVVMRYPMRFEARGKRLRAQRVPGEALWQGRQVTLREGDSVVIR